VKCRTDDLAVFGGPPLFTSPRPIGQLHCPGTEEFLETVKEAFSRRHLTNDGPLMRRLERRLARFHGVVHCIALANAGLGITMLMQLFSGGRRGEVIMPAFSYRGLPHFAQWAGQTPRFCDVDRLSHALDPRSVESSLSERTTSVLSVCNFNDPGDVDELCRVARARGVPIFLDSVYAVGSTYRGKMMGPFADAEVYSLHATKLLNGFEGGYVTTDDNQLAEKLRWQRNFTLPGLTPSVPDAQRIVGVNAKLNEMHAAMALLSLERVESIIARNREIFEAYRQGIAAVEGLSLVPYGEREKRNYQMAVLETGPGWALTRDQTVALLRAEGAAISGYYSPALHRSEHCPPGVEVPELPAAEELSGKFVQLPVGEMVNKDDVRRICQLLSFVGDDGAAVAGRMRRGGAP
jgi:dTDP-4-amino-4,6-dideoxygalactose transaminase